MDKRTPDPRLVIAKADHDYHHRIRSDSCAMCLAAADHTILSLTKAGLKIVPQNES